MSEIKKKSSRVLTFDLLRGYFMLSIILNHLQWYPNGLDFVAFRGSLFVSAAEGFFIISGIVLGIIRGRKLLEQPFKVAASLLILRGVRLYIIAVVLMLLFTFIGWQFMGNEGLKPGIRPIDQSLWEVIYGALTFNYIYGWADFLRLYSIFLIASPIALWLLRKNKWYILLAINIGIWALSPFFEKSTDLSTELLMPLSWQLIFFGGFTIGFYWEKLVEKWQALSIKTQQYILTPILAVAAGTLVLNILITTLGALPVGILSSFGHSVELTLAPLFNKETLTPLRLLLFALWFILGFYVFNRYEAKIVKWFGWILIPFGSNSLYVYIMHAVILFFAHLLIAPDATDNIFVNGIATIAIIGLILLAVNKQFLFKIIPR